MQFRHPAHRERTVHLAYCLNLHPADDLDETLAGMRAVTLPLRERLAPGSEFGVGAYLSNRFARRLASARGEGELKQLARFFADNGLRAFTFNAFPHSRFHTDGLKADVFKPTWRENERLEFTIAVARSAVALLHATSTPVPSDHLSISTHTGMFGAWVKGPADLDECAMQLARAVDALARIEEETGVRVVLSLEPEPCANAGDSAQLLSFFERARGVGWQVLEEEHNRGSDHARALHARHLGHCLDTCHSAIGQDEDALRTLHGVTLGKIQYSNAVVVRQPWKNQAGVDALLALDEPRYLHQVAGLGAGGSLLVDDLPELKAALASPAGAEWLRCDEWLCHFHVPVDLDSAGAGLSTTRQDSDHCVRSILEAPARWTTNDLHLEIETYTWDILPTALRGPGALVDGLEREYQHVIGLLEGAGWRRA